MGKKVPLGRDWLALGITSGMTASIVKSALNLGLEKVGVPTVPYHDFTAGWVLGKRATLLGHRQGRVETPGQGALGFVAETIYGGLFGSVISYFTAKSPPGREVLKGAFGGAVVWCLVTVGLNQFRRPRRFTGGQMATLLGTNVAWGSMHGAMIGYAASRANQLAGAGRRFHSHPRLVRHLPRLTAPQPWTEPGMAAPGPLPLDEGLTPTLH